MKTYLSAISELKPNEVFVFGSNLNGFHGAGSAGFASFNESGNVWRKYGYDKWPDGKRGKWNIKGVGWGFQEGEIGKSYAIPTVVKAGAKRSIPLTHIRKHIETFRNFALGSAGYNFYIAQGAGQNLNGYSLEEMRTVWLEGLSWSDNVFFKKDFFE